MRTSLSRLLHYKCRKTCNIDGIFVIKKFIVTHCSFICCTKVLKIRFLTDFRHKTFTDPTNDELPLVDKMRSSFFSLLWFYFFFTFFFALSLSNVQNDYNYLEPDEVYRDEKTGVCVRENKTFKPMQLVSDSIIHFGHNTLQIELLMLQMP